MNTARVGPLQICTAVLVKIKTLDSGAPGALLRNRAKHRFDSIQVGFLVLNISIIIIDKRIPG